MSGAAAAAAMGSTQMATPMATVSFTSATGTAPNDTREGNVSPWMVDWHL